MALYSKTKGQQNRIPIEIHWAKKYEDKLVPADLYLKAVAQVLSIHLTNTFPDKLDKDRDHEFGDLVQYGFPDWTSLNAAAIAAKIKSCFEKNETSRRPLNFILGWHDEAHSVCRAVEDNAIEILKLNRYFVLRSISNANAKEPTEISLKSPEKYLASILNAITTADVAATDADETPSDENLVGFNALVFGAPGTGKSYELNRRYPQAIRTIFHSEYSNAEFVVRDFQQWSQSISSDGSHPISSLGSTRSVATTVTQSWIPLQVFLI